MNANFKDKLRYQFEQFLAKGGTSIFLSLTVVFMVFFISIIIIRGLLLLAFPDFGYQNYLEDFWGHIWAIFLQMTDPGNMNQDNDASFITKVTTILAGISGVVILSMLIAFITTELEKTLYDFRKGRGPVVEEEHTLILGWNERVVEILKELIMANESESSATVVVLSEEEKEFVDDYISNNISDTVTTKIVTSQGSTTNINELKRVQATEARSIIIVAECSGNANEEEKLLSDTKVLKTILALKSIMREPEEGEESIPIISEVFSEEKRKMVSYLDDENVIALDSWDIMGKLLVQTSLTSGLEVVYREMLSFDRSEVYFYDNDWGGILFSDVMYHMPDGVPLGIYTEEEGVVLRPPADTILNNGDEIIVLAEDDSTLDFSESKLYNIKEMNYTPKEQDQFSKNILILGWHNTGDIFVEESNDYLKEGSKFDIVINKPNERIVNHLKELDEENTNIDIKLHDINTFDIDNLKQFEIYNYDTILVLSQNPEDKSNEKIDSDTLMILLLLRKIARDNSIDMETNKTKIITQVLNPNNQDLLQQTDVDDFIISNSLITMILAQLSEEPKIKQFYDDIFQEDGSEIYVKPAHLYFDSFPVTVNFATVCVQANKRDEICLGVRKSGNAKNPEDNYGIELNINKAKDVTLEADDFLVVLSEDEL